MLHTVYSLDLNAHLFTLKVETWQLTRSLIS